MAGREKWIVAATLWGATLAPLAVAQSAPQRESLTVGPGDQVHITVFGAPELEQHTKVTDSGEINLTLGGVIRIGGDTPIVAAHQIEDVLKRDNYLLDPHVAVSIERSATQTVSVLGAVKTPAAYPLDTPRSIFDVLAVSGGLTEGASRHITIRRHATGEKVTYFLSNSPERALDNAPLVYPGDEVFVPSADKYYLIGDFNHSGAFANTTDQPSITMLQALALAGSTPPTAVPSNAKLIRKLPDGTYMTTLVDISAIQKGKQPDFLLQPNDVVYVPFSYLKNIAVGLGSILASATSAALYTF